MNKRFSPDTLHVGQPNVGNRAVFNHLVDQMFDRCWFSNNGQLVQELEKKICKFLGVKHCIMVCNATVGMQIACHALGLKGEVILPSFTFVATAHAIQWEGIQPVFADINPKTHTVDPVSIESLVTDKTSAIVGVHLWGTPCDTNAILKIAEKFNLAVMYDAAHAFGSMHDGQMVGNFGACEVFSFHATKFFNTFEGGAITTNDDHLAEKFRLMKNFGFAGMDNVLHLGTNGKMPEVCAAMGLACFESIDEILETNFRNYSLYKKHLSTVPGIRFLEYDSQEKTNWQYIVIEVSKSFPISRNEVIAHLHSVGIRARRYFYPGCHQMEPYRSIYPRQKHRLPVTDRVAGQVICLPTGTAINQADVIRVCHEIESLAP